MEFKLNNLLHSVCSLIYRNDFLEYSTAGCLVTFMANVYSITSE